VNEVDYAVSKSRPVWWHFFFQPVLSAIRKVAGSVDILLLPRIFIPDRSEDRLWPPHAFVILSGAKDLLSIRQYLPLRHGQ
jgi:hypothetical protein